MRNYLVVACLLFSAGCASTSTFNAYTSQSAPFIQRMDTGTPIDLNKELVQQTQSADKILYLMERGRIAQIQGDFDTSKKSFEDAISAIKIDDQKAIVSASGAGAQAGAVLLNDNAIPYKGDGYERVMLYHFQAMNYLAKNDIDGAGVEVRRANAEQEAALKRHAKELEDAENSAKKHKVPSAMPASVSNAYANLDQLTGSIKDSFQNAYTFYLSGIVEEMQGQPNDAYIDYKKALEIFPENTYVQKDVVRLAQQLKMTDDLAQFKTKYPKAVESLSSPVSGGELIVLFEDDFVPHKEQIKIPIPISLQAPVLTAAAFPIYNVKSMAVFPLTFSEGANAIATSEPICFMGSLALKALKEKVPAIVIRQIIRSSIKAVEAAQAKQQLGVLGGLAVSAFNFISENADLRSWTTLPFDIQIIRINLAPGEHNFLMSYVGGVTASVKVTIKDNEKIIFRVLRTGSQLRVMTLYPAAVVQPAAQPAQAPVSAPAAVPATLPSSNK